MAGDRAVLPGRHTGLRGLRGDAHAVPAAGAGPAAGGLVTAALGLRGATTLDAGTFAVAAAACALITGRHRADRGDDRSRRLFRELAEGLRAITGNRIARAIGIFLTVTAVGEGMMLTLFAV